MTAVRHLRLPFVRRQAIKYRLFASGQPASQARSSLRKGRRNLLFYWGSTVNIRFRHSLQAAALGVAASFSALADAQQMPRVDLSVGMYRVSAEVAATDANRMQGLMQRTAMAANQGMLFVFPMAARHCMWMRNTLIPLSVAFIDDAGKIINVEDMLPKTENNHCAGAPARFALEMNKGWFAAKGFGTGVRINGLEQAPAPQ
jgi:uncharacterized membrane protein (UPF0127 family)